MSVRCVGTVQVKGPKAPEDEDGEAAYSASLARAKPAASQPPVTNAFQASCPPRTLL